MTYASSVAYLYGLQKHGIKLGLERMTALVARLGRPEAKYQALHVGGTNGKGSTAAMAAAMLEAEGYRVGLYTSPHLVEFRERIRVNGEMISESDVARITEQVMRLCDAHLSPTFFECTTAMALQYFAESRVDIAVLEVGLGGRFDATNVVTPLASAIITIGLDHQEYLGTTLRSVAFEKAGIIKPDVPVIVGRVCADAYQTIDQVARECAAPLSLLGREFEAIGSADLFAYSGLNQRYKGLRCALEGVHQVDNAACAIALLEAAGSGGLRLTEGAVRDGLRRVHWEGRIEIVDRQPMTILDGAHNPAAAGVLAEYLRSYRRSHPARRVILVLAMMRDKDHSGFVDQLTNVVDEVVLTQVDLPRSATVEQLQAAIGDRWLRVHVRAGLSDAMAQARQLAGINDVICVTGSLMLIGDMKGLSRGCELSPLRG